MRSAKISCIVSASQQEGTGSHLAGLLYFSAGWADRGLGVMSSALDGYTSEANLNKLFLPAEDISKCAPKLIGGEVPTPTLMPSAEKNACAQCARAIDIAGQCCRSERS